MTVGLGITPSLLTLPYGRRSRARRVAPLPPVGNCTPPWERKDCMGQPVAFVSQWLATCSFHLGI